MSLKYRDNNLKDPYTAIANCVRDNEKGYAGFLVRGVISDTKNNMPKMLICVVEAIPSTSNVESNDEEYDYDNVSIFRERWDTARLAEFLDDLQKGKIFGAFSVPTSSNHWTREHLPLSNRFMLQAGQVFYANLFNEAVRQGDPLLALEQPYYPDLDAAICDWFSFPTFHGWSDSRIGQLLFLFPETRAYFKDVKLKKECLDVYVGGTKSLKPNLLTKGAWWLDGKIAHFEAPVNSAIAKICVPREADRLEYFLMDKSGHVYDFQKESRYGHDGLGRHRLGRAAFDVVDVITKAIEAGEGENVEFKPFVDIEHQKMAEIFRAVCAFANGKGGWVFLGISDDCEILGIGAGLQKWAKAKPDDAALEKYEGAIKNRIRSKVVGDMPLNVDSGVINDAIITVITVGQSKDKPVYIDGESVVYLRRGASCAKVPPPMVVSLFQNRQSITD